MKTKVYTEKSFPENQKKAGPLRVAHINLYAESVALKDLQEKAKLLPRNYSNGGYQGL